MVRISTLVLGVCLLMNESVSTQDLNQDLLLNYSFEGSFEDSSPNGFDGTPFNTQLSVDRFGNPSSAITFDGDGCVELPQSQDLKPDFPFTIALWFYPRVEFIRAEGLIGTDQFFNNYHGAFISILSTGRIMVGYGDGCGSTGPECRRSMISMDQIENRKWYHVVGIYESPTEISIYVNGCLAPSSSSGNGDFNIRYSNQAGGIGKMDHSDIPSNPIGFYHGSIDDVYYWDRVVSEEEIDLLVGDFFGARSTTLEYNGCSGDLYETEINNTVYNENNPSGLEYFDLDFGCDSTVVIDLGFERNDELVIDTTVCDDDLFIVEINGSVFNNNNPEGIEYLTNQFGCDSTIYVDLNFSNSFDTLIQYLGCEGDGFAYATSQSTYDESNPSGFEIYQGVNGCDSTIRIDLMFDSASSSQIAEQHCTSSNYQLIIGNTVYDNDNPTGLEIITNAVGCDSVISIELLFVDDILDSISYFGCIDDGYSLITEMNVFNQSNPTGVEQYLTNSGCDSIVVYDFYYRELDSTMIFLDICNDENFELMIGDDTYNIINPIGETMLLNTVGCDSLVFIELSFSETKRDTFQYFGCQGDLFEYETSNSIYNEQFPIGEESYILANGCDSIHVIELFFAQQTSLQIDTILCDEEFTVDVNGETFDITNPSGTIMLNNLFGCDSTITINLEYHTSFDTLVQYFGCSGDGYSYQTSSTQYNEKNPTGVEVFETINGCDSIITVDLQFRANSNHLIDSMLCDEQDFELILNGEIFSSSNPQGNQTLVNAEGCDSIIMIDLQYSESFVDTVLYQGVSGDGYTFSTSQTTYDEGNPFGIESYIGASGCDSTIVVELYFEDLECGFFLPNILHIQTNPPNNSFLLGVSPNCPLDFGEVIIYDRYGNLIFRSQDPAFSWQGMYDGNLVQQGIYTYIISYSLLGQLEYLSGDVVVTY